MGFFTIFIPPGLSERDYERALSAGSSFVSTRRREHQEMLASAGFRDVTEIDLTAEFLETTRAWYYGREHHADALIAAEGRELFDERQADSWAQMGAIEAGLLRRALFLCR